MLKARPRPSPSRPRLARPADWARFRGRRYRVYRQCLILRADEEDLALAVDAGAEVDVVHAGGVMDGVDEGHVLGWGEYSEGTGCEEGGRARTRV